MGRIIMVLYMEALLLSVLTIWFLYHIIKKKKIFRWENAPLDMRDFVKRNEKRMNMISNGIIGIILIPAFLRVVLPAVQDFPNINSGNYLEVEGTVTSWNYSDEDKNKTRAIGIMDNKTKKEIFVDFEKTEDKTVSMKVDKGVWEDFLRLCSNTSHDRKTLVTQALSDFMKVHKDLL